MIQENNITTGYKNGSLIVIGGGYVPDAIMKEFWKLAGGDSAKIIVIPTAQVLNDEIDTEYFKGFFEKHGFTDITIVHTSDPAEANKDAFIQPIKEATGIYFMGGRHWRIADSFLNTKAHDEMFKLLDRGGVIAGSSAGASIQGSYLARGDSKSNQIMMGDHEVGLGFISNITIDQHVFVRNRLFDIFEILDNKPELLGIGIDESTGIVVQGDKFRVIGKSYVAIYDGTRWSEDKDTIYKLSKGSREFYTLKFGDEYDLRKRRVIKFNDRDFVSISKNEIKKYVGNYKLKGEDYVMEILIKNDTLKAHQKWDEYEYSLFAKSDTTFYINSNVFLEFNFNENGTIDRFSVPRENETWEKIIE